MAACKDQASIDRSPVAAMHSALLPSEVAAFQVQGMSHNSCEVLFAVRMFTT